MGKVFNKFYNYDVFDKNIKKSGDPLNTTYVIGGHYYSGNPDTAYYQISFIDDINGIYTNDKLWYNGIDTKKVVVDYATLEQLVNYRAYSKPSEESVYRLCSLNKTTKYYLCATNNVYSASNEQMVITVPESNLNDYDESSFLFRCKLYDDKYVFESIKYPGQYMYYRIGYKTMVLGTVINNCKWTVNTSASYHTNSSALYSEFSSKYLLLSDSGVYDHANNNFNNTNTIYCGDFSFELLSENTHSEHIKNGYRITENTDITLKVFTKYEYPESETTTLLANNTVTRCLYYNINNLLYLVCFTKNNMDDLFYTLSYVFSLDDQKEIVNGYKINNGIITYIDEESYIFTMSLWNNYNLSYKFNKSELTSKINDVVNEKLNTQIKYINQDIIQLQNDLTNLYNSYYYVQSDISYFYSTNYTYYINTLIDNKLNPLNEQLKTILGDE